MPAIARTTDHMTEQFRRETLVPRRPETYQQHRPILHNVMIVDDSRIDRALHSRALSRSGVIGDMVEFSDGEVAFDHLQQNPTKCPDAILLDVNMPSMDAYDFLTAATSKLGMGFTKAVVILTSIPLLPRDHKRLMAFEIVKHFLEKPLNEAEIRAMATNVYAKVSGSADPQRSMVRP